MKSTAKKKTFVNNMITLGMVAAAWLIMEILMNTGHVSSLLKGLLVPFCIYVIMAVSLNLTVGILGELSLGHAGFMCVGAFAGALFSKCMKGTLNPTVSLGDRDFYRRCRCSCLRYPDRYPGFTSAR